MCVCGCPMPLCQSSAASIMHAEVHASLCVRVCVCVYTCACLHVCLLSRAAVLLETVPMSLHVFCCVCVCVCVHAGTIGTNPLRMIRRTGRVARGKGEAGAGLLRRDGAEQPTSVRTAHVLAVYALYCPTLA